MEKKDFIKIINEEISNFDFLGNDAQTNEEDNINLLKNEDFQKQFICDSLINKKNLKIGVQDSTLGGDYDEDPENASSISITYNVNIEYKYDQSKEPVKFDLYFDADRVTISKDGWYDAGNGIDIAPEGDAWFNSFEWDDINVTLFTTDGDEIKFIAFEKAPPRIQTLFVREFTEDFISNYTRLEIRTPEMKDKIQNVPYC